MKGKPKMKTKNVLLKFALCAVVALSSCAALADMPRTSYSYHALSRSEWALEQKDESVKSFRDKLYEHSEEGCYSMGVSLSLLAFVYIFLRKRKRFSAAKKFLFFLPLTLPCLAFLFWSTYICFPRSGVAYAISGEIGKIGGHVDVTVKPKAGETYEEYLDRVRALNDEEYRARLNYRPQRPRPRDKEFFH